MPWTTSSPPPPASAPRCWLSNRADDLRSFVAEHASGLRMLAKVLRWVGMALVAVKFGGKVLDKLAPRVAERLRRIIDDVVTPAPSREELIDELARRGVKHTPENIVAIGRDPGGRIVFPETGSPSAGLEHILLKKTQYAKQGVGEDHVAEYVFTAVTSLAVDVGDNGLIVGANPVD
jgi:hypothetical protein